jgi:O-antigen ligase
MMVNINAQHGNRARFFVFLLVVFALIVGVLISYINNISLVIAMLGGIILLLLVSVYLDPILPIIIACWGVSHAVLSLETLSIGVFLGQDITISRALGAMITIGIATNLLLSKKRLYFLNDPAVRIYSIFALWATSAALFWSEPTEGISFLIRFLSEFSIFLAFYKIGTFSKKLYRIPLLMTTVGCVSALIAISQYMGLDVIRDFYEQWGIKAVRASSTEGIARASGILGGAFVSSGIMMILLAHAATLWAKSFDKMRRWITASAIALILLGILATLTRATILGAIALIAIWAMLKQRIEGKSLVSMIILVVIIVLGIAVADLVITGGSLRSRVVTDLEDPSNGRVPMWSVVLSEFSRLGPLGWLIGGGIGFSFIGAMKLWGIQWPPHNQYLWLLADVGLVGLMLYLVFLIRIIKRFYSCTSNYKIFAAYFALIIAVTLIFANSWNYTGNAAFSWFYLSTVGFALGLTRNSLLSSSSREVINT